MNGRTASFFWRKPERAWRKPCISPEITALWQNGSAQTWRQRRRPRQAALKISVGWMPLRRISPHIYSEAALRKSGLIWKTENGTGNVPLLCGLQRRYTAMHRRWSLGICILCSAICVWLRKNGSWSGCGKPWILPVWGLKPWCGRQSPIRRNMKLKRRMIIRWWWMQEKRRSAPLRRAASVGRFCIMWKIIRPLPMASWFWLTQVRSGSGITGIFPEPSPSTENLRSGRSWSTISFWRDSGESLMPFVRVCSSVVWMNCWRNIILRH